MHSKKILNFLEKNAECLLQIMSDLTYNYVTHTVTQACQSVTQACHTVTQACHTVTQACQSVHEADGSVQCVFFLDRSVTIMLDRLT